MLIRCTAHEIVDIVRLNRHRCAVIDRAAVCSAHELVVIRRACRISDVSKRIIVRKLIIVTCIRIHKLRICIVDLVDARLLAKIEIQYAAINRARVRHLKLIRARDLNVAVVQAELVRHRIRRPVRRIRT